MLLLALLELSKEPIFIATGKLVNLSEQQLVDCDNTVRYLVLSFNLISIHPQVKSLLVYLHIVLRNQKSWEFFVFSLINHYIKIKIIDLQALYICP